MVNLDVLRGVAILLVLGRHMAPPPPTWPEGLRKVLGAWQYTGWMGVDLFFVLSGFLVTGLILRELRRTGTFLPMHFLVRRGFKIYPGFYVFLLLGLPLIAWIPDRVRPLSLLSESLFVQNYGPNIWPHTWSLAVEEHFYLLLVAVLYLLSRRTDGLRAFPYLAGACLAVPLALRFLTLRSEPAVGFYTHVVLTHLRLDSLALGALLAWVYQVHPEPLARAFRGRALLWVPVALLLVSVCSFYSYDRWYSYTLGLSAASLGFALLVMVAVHGRPLTGVVAALLAGIGYYSYSIYLWHLPVSYGVYLAGPAPLGIPLPMGVRIGLYFAGSLAVGIAMARLVEVPFLRLRDRFFPSRSGLPVRDAMAPPEDEAGGGLPGVESDPPSPEK